MRNLPHQLVEAFRSTLEEVADSDVIVHVVDGSHPDPASQLATVRDVIGEVGARDIPEIVVFNKSDLIVDDDQRSCCAASSRRAVFVSARTGEGIDELLDAHRASSCRDPTIEVDLLVPYDRGDLVSHAARARPRAQHRLRRGRHARARPGLPERRRGPRAVRAAGRRATL